MEKLDNVKMVLLEHSITGECHGFIVNNETSSTIHVNKYYYVATDGYWIGKVISFRLETSYNILKYKDILDYTPAILIEVKEPTNEITNIGDIFNANQLKNFREYCKNDVMSISFLDNAINPKYSEEKG